MVKFLVVDDDPVSRELLSAFLAPYGHCEQAEDGHEALERIQAALGQRSPYDLVCLDIMMPGCDGHGTLDAIRLMEHRAGVRGSGGAKVLMTTAVTNPRHCLQAFREGCDGYLTKPIDEARLLTEVRRLLGELPTAVPHRRGRYLIVDDDAVCRELLKDILSVHGECDLAYDGAEAIDAVRLALEDGAPYDLVCLDIMMPGTSGHDALQTIRQIEARYGVLGSDGAKIIMTTALRDPKHCIAAFREGCESYVTKPIREEQLLAAMRQLGLLRAATDTA